MLKDEQLLYRGQKKKRFHMVFIPTFSHDSHFTRANFYTETTNVRVLLPFVPNVITVLKLL